MTTLTLYVVAVIFAATLIRSTLGFGEALVAVPLLALRIPVDIAAPLAVLVSVVVAAAMLARDWRHIEVRSASGLVAAAFVGIPIGLWLLTRANDVVVKSLLGAIIIAFSLHTLLGRHPRRAGADHAAWLLGCGLLSGILGGAYGMNGPPLVVYGTLRGWSPRHFRATLQAYFLPASLAGLIGYASIGLWTRAVTSYFLWSLPGIAAAILLGRYVNDRTGTQGFFRLVHVGLVLIGIALLVQAVA
jgi:uncharacterized membrane protein YfcA